MRSLALLLVATAVFVTVVAAAPPQNPQALQVPIGPGGRGAPVPAPPLTGTGLILGRVVEADSNTPIGGAVVSLSGRGVTPPRVIVDAQGRFVFRDLPAGDLTLTAAKPGYFGGGWGQRSPLSPPRPLDLNDDERLGDVSLRLWKFATIRGEITDEANQPVVGTEVLAFRRSALNGRWQFTSAGEATTDDRGAFSLTNLTPGSYVVAGHSLPDDYQRPLVSMLFADPSSFMSLIGRAATGDEPDPSFSGKARTFPMTFFPQALSPADATLITLKAAEEHAGVNLSVRAVPLLNVTGAVMGVPNPGSVRLRLTLPDSGGLFTADQIATTRPDDAGRFTFSGVPAGRYLLRAVLIPAVNAGAGSGAGRGVPPTLPGVRGARAGGLPPTPTDPILSASIPITLEDADIHDIAITLRPGVPVGGRIEFQGQIAPPDSSQYTSISFSLSSLDSSSAETAVALRGRVEEDGLFRSAGVIPGSYLLRIGSVGRWRPASAMLAGKDLLDQPLEIDTVSVENLVVRFTDLPLASLTGTVRDTGGGADAEAVILVFPTDRALWGDLTTLSRRVKAARTTRSGYYAIPGLAAGEYFIVAGADTLLADWATPAALDAASRLATRVVVADGEKKPLDLQSRPR